ncbi:hypothetical protein [Methylobacterium aerolatum]|uniref:Uncharacterized protein n=1 Tax=Methylobacterium aerolatum TaxID=418708 RepID=A0ABU0HWK2_9HYPH|nr:hypothetical protein [Methylobacterium aerolatum]MDQ0446095.1 hypothetical protein [Methylobacterium aerolatum]GJD35131.1 hypothetical protein FMGBMHLM_2039 [Methylobacterium aerolatum]
MIRACLCVLSLLVATSVTATERHRSRGAGSVPPLDQGSEARITQAPARAMAPARPVPETEAKNAPVRGPSAPITCNEQNASSPSCYTATQQARPITR